MSTTTVYQRGRWITLSQAADRLGVAPRTLRRMVARGQLTAYCVGDTPLLRVDTEDVDQCLHAVPTRLLDRRHGDVGAWRRTVQPRASRRRHRSRDRAPELPVRRPLRVGSPGHGLRSGLESRHQGAQGELPTGLQTWPDDDRHDGGPRRRQGSTRGGRVPGPAPAPRQERRKVTGAAFGNIGWADLDDDTEDRTITWPDDAGGDQRHEASVGPIGGRGLPPVPDQTGQEARRALATG